MPTPRKNETHEQMLARYREEGRNSRKWQAVKRTINQRTGEETTVYVPNRTAYTELSGATLARRSTLVDAEGNVIQEWRIEKPEDKARWEALQAALEEFKAAYKPLPPFVRPFDCYEPLCTGYPIGDHHLGMLAWWREVGTSYDLDIAEELLAKAMDYLVDRAPPSKFALIATLGDFLHYDSMKAVTPEHGHILDQDSRAGKMVRVTTRLLFRIIERAAEKHEFVHVIVEFGNHDPFSTLWIMELLRVRYENNPRINVDTSPGAFHYYRFGANFIATHHGDTCKLAQLPGVMAARRPQDWGETKYRTWWTGHRHSHLLQTFNGCTVEQFPVLPPADAYAHMLGYEIDRKMMSIVYDREHGEVDRHTFRPEFLK